MSGVPSGGSMWKNILIGILTTVVAYSIVNYIKDKKEKRKEKEKIKTETVDAWNSLIKYEEQSTVNYYAAFCNENTISQMESLIYEKDQLAKNYGIIGAKREIDDDLASFVTRAIGNTNEIKKILEDYRDDLKNIDASATNAALLYKNLDSVYDEKINSARERDMESLRTTLQSLIKKYGEVFNVPDNTPSFRESDLTGRWKETGLDKFFDIKSNNTFIMEASGNNYPGKWKLSDKTISLTYDDGSGSITLNIIYYNSRYFRFTLNEETNERQCCKK